ncbi:MAG: photoactive yellow protein [Bacteroidia bacterium]|nr:photoactive yellow protein [Bacteroidia bacterium]
MNLFTRTAPEVMSILSTLSGAAFDTLDVGVVEMDLQGQVLRINQYETDLSGIPAHQSVGKHFFSQVAPCTNNFMVAQRYIDTDSLDEMLDYVFTYRMKPTRVRLRMLKAAAEPLQYLLVMKL